MALTEPPRFCPRCGRPFEATTPPARCIDAACGWVWYRDPKVGTGVVATDAHGHILLVRRNHEPRMGLWAFPSGFVDAGEVVEDAAVREVREETGVEVRLDGLLGVYSEAGEQVIFVAYAGTIVAGEPRAGDEAIEVGLFAPDALPPLAFDHDDQIVEAWRAVTPQPAASNPPTFDHMDGNDESNGERTPESDRQANVEATAARIGGMLGRFARRVASNAKPEAERAIQIAGAAAAAARPHIEHAAQQAGHQAVEFAKAHEDDIRRAAEAGARVAADRIVPPVLRPVVNAADQQLHRDRASEPRAAAASTRASEDDDPKEPKPTDPAARG